LTSSDLQQVTNAHRPVRTIKAVTDEEVREFLARNPDVLRDFLARESRLGARWLSAYIRQLQRTGRLENVDRILRR
jgi:hypothetical protein